LAALVVLAVSCKHELLFRQFYFDVDNAAPITLETPTNIRVSGAYLPVYGEKRPVLIYFTDNTIDDGYIDGTTGIVVINHRREEGGTQKTFHTLRLHLPNPADDKRILLGRKFDGEHIDLSIDADGNLALRPAQTNNPNDPGVPYIPIGTMAEFYLINTDGATRGGAYLQTHDLDMLGPRTGMDGDLVHNWAPIGMAVDYNTPAEVFRGIFDGGGKEIRNLWIDRPNAASYGYNIGLFGYAGSGAALKNITVSSGSVTGYRSVGGIAGYITGASITACSNSGNVSAGSYYVGGVAGSVVSASSIAACSNSGDVEAGSSDAGGVAGYVGGGSSIIACSNSGNVEAGYNEAGGVAGFVEGGSSITACSNTGNVSVGNWYVGGVAGAVVGGSSITTCYWLDLPTDNAGYGVGNTSSNAQAALFGAGSWPSEGDASWGIGNDPPSGKYWKTLGQWVGGNDGRDSSFPKLWWQD
jgi:hypothetical protein